MNCFAMTLRALPSAVVILMMIGCSAELSVKISGSTVTRHLTPVAAKTTSAPTSTTQSGTSSAASSGPTLSGTVTFTTPSDTINKVSYNSKAAYTIAGTCIENGLTVSLSIASPNTSLGSTSCAGGTWSIAVDFSSLSDGTYGVIATHANGTTTLAGLVVDKEYCSGKTGLAPYAGGTGVVGDPYTICTRLQLEQIQGGGYCAAGVYFTVKNDIDLSGAEWLIPNCNGAALAGEFDGGNFTLDSMNVTLPNGYGGFGLFTSIDSTGVVKNIKFKNVNVITGANSAGMVASSAIAGATITNVMAAGILSGNSWLGGIVSSISGAGASTFDQMNVNLALSGGQGVGSVVGLVSGGVSLTITNAVTAGSVQASWISAGGIVGEYAGAVLSISNSSSTVSLTNSPVNAGGSVGGIIGNVQTAGASVSNSSWTGTMTSCGSAVGGIIGDVHGVGAATISNSWTSGTINAGAVAGGQNNLGGLVGWGVTVNISDSHSSVNITGTAGYVGGIVGYLNGNTTVSRVYATGSVSGERVVGGFAGKLEDCGGTCTVALTNAYATGAVTGVIGEVGGFAGDVQIVPSSIFYTYSTGAVTSGGAFVGGWSGWSAGTTDNVTNFWDADLSGIPAISANGTAQLHTDMLLQATFVGAGFDFATVWKMPAGGGTPVFQ